MAAPSSFFTMCTKSKFLHCLYNKYSTHRFGIHTGLFINTSYTHGSTKTKDRCIDSVKICQINVSSVNTSTFRNRTSCTCTLLLNRLSTCTFSSSASVSNGTPDISNHGYCFARQKATLLSASCSPNVTSFLGQFNCQRNYCLASVSPCWSCNAEIKLADTNKVQFFCDTCNAIQPVNPDANYFQLMNCKATFDLDPAQLTQIFRNLQRQLHPDKFSIRSKEEQDYSAGQSSEVNRAYTTLLKPLSRGLYLLELNGLTIEEGDAGIEPEFLMEVMETNEELADTRDEAIVRRIGKENAVKLEALLKDLSGAFSEKDFPSAREILIRLKYFANIDDKVKERLEKHS